MVFLFGWGEPFLWPHLAEGITLARKMNVKTDVTTSASFAYTESVREVIEASPDLLVIALDSHLPEVYEKYRLGACFEETLQTTRHIIESCSSDTTVVMQMIRWPEMNTMENDYRYFAKKLGSVEVAIRRSFREEDMIKMFSPEMKRRPCPVLWQGPAYICTNGTVYPCCLLKDFPIGNICSDELSTCWNSDNMQYLRESHRKNDFSSLPECRNCYHTSPQGYPSVYALAGCLFGGPLARRWMFRIDGWRNSLEILRSSFDRRETILPNNQSPNELT